MFLSSRLLYRGSPLSRHRYAGTAPAVSVVGTTTATPHHAMLLYSKRCCSSSSSSSSSSSNDAISGDSAASSSNNNGGDGDAAASVDQLRTRIRVLEEQLKVKDESIRELLLQKTAAASSPTSHFEHDPSRGRFIVSTGEDLAAAVDSGAHHILISTTTSTSSSKNKRNNPPLYLPYPVTVHGDHVLLIERLPPSSTAAATNGDTPRNDDGDNVCVVGNWKLEQRAKVHSNNIVYSGDGVETSSLFFLSTGASLSLHGCVLRSAREAVYLSSSTQAVLSGCRITDNVRGIFESFRSQCKLVGCEFQQNVFHAVLLSTTTNNSTCCSNSRSSATSTSFLTAPQQSRLEGLAEMGNVFYCSKRTRADVCFTYNPIMDRYDDVYLKGVKTVLTESEATCNLVDATW